MKATEDYEAYEPDRREVDGWRGATVLEFGAAWCGFCQSAQGPIGAAFAAVGAPDGLRHLKIADGKGRPLGRSFGVKLWPTLVFLRDGQEIARVVRPTDAGVVADALDKIR